MVAQNSPLVATDYVAILKCKQGEMLAVSKTNSQRFVPLFELVDLGRVTALIRNWPSASDVIWVQPIALDPADPARWAAGITSAFSNFQANNIAAVPVVTLDEDPATYAAVSAIASSQGRGIVIRLDCEDALEEDITAFSSRIAEVIRACGVSHQTCDVVVDAGLVSGGAAVQATAAHTALKSLPMIAAWRSVVVAFSGFPESVNSFVSVSSVGRIPRTDAAAFNHLTARWRTQALSFADYGVGVPTYSNIPFTPIPNIRYAIAGEWVVHRGSSRKSPGPQYIQLAKNLVGSPDFCGQNFSDGDQYLSQVAAGNDGPGNATSYLRVAMSHHFAVVLDSLANLGAP